MVSLLKQYRSLAILVLVIACLAAVTKINLKEQSVPPGNNGQLLFNNNGVTDAEDPIVSGPDAVGATPTKNPVQTGCLFLTTPATLTNNQVGAIQCDSTQNMLVHVVSVPTTTVTGTITANQGGTWTVQPGNTANTTPWLATINQGGNSANVSSSNSLKVQGYPDTVTTSYHASAKFAASSTTDNAVMPGNATNTVLLTKVTVSCTQTTAGQINVELLKRSAADTSGMSTNMTKVPDDANYAGAVSAPLSYTGTGPSVGAAVGDLDNLQIGCMASGTATPNDIYIFRPAKPIILRGTAQQVAVNVGNAALTGGTLTVTFDWMETTTP